MNHDESLVCYENCVSCMRTQRVLISLFPMCWNTEMWVRESSVASVVNRALVIVSLKPPLHVHISCPHGCEIQFMYQDTTFLHAASSVHEFAALLFSASWNDIEEHIFASLWFTLYERMLRFPTHTRCARDSVHTFWNGLSWYTRLMRVTIDIPEHVDVVTRCCYRSPWYIRSQVSCHPPIFITSVCGRMLNYKAAHLRLQHIVVKVLSRKIAYKMWYLQS